MQFITLFYDTNEKHVFCVQNELLKSHAFAMDFCSIFLVNIESETTEVSQYCIVCLRQ